MKLVRIGLMASGRGSNAEAILRACANGQLPAEGSVVISNNDDAGVHEVAAAYGVPSQTMRRDQFDTGSAFAEALIHAFRASGTELICLAGYMKKIPPALIRAYPGAMLNIHPALLPKFGGKGMYGHFVHEAVIEAGEPETGVTVHFVNEEYDEGAVLLQRGGVPVKAGDTADTLAARVLELEHTLYPEAVFKWIEAFNQQ